MASFQLVENKIYEAHFFLEKINECNKNQYLEQCNYYLSAFVSSARSITFALQKCMKDVSDFNEWYKDIRILLFETKIARFFVDARNKSEKEGITLVGSGSKSGLYFQDIYFEGDYTDYDYREHVMRLIKENFGELVIEDNQTMKNKTVYDLCREYLTLLLRIVFWCFQRYGDFIDPAKYYTLSTMKRHGKTIEDYEEELGYPRGWTDIPLEESKRMRILNEMVPKSEVFLVLCEYLGEQEIQKYFDSIEV